MPRELIEAVDIGRPLWLVGLDDGQVEGDHDPLVLLLPLRSRKAFEAALAPFEEVRDKVAADWRNAQTGDVAYERAGAALERAPDHPELNHTLARLLATCTDPEVRDGGRALELAEGLRRESGAPLAAATPTCCAR